MVRGKSSSFGEYARLCKWILDSTPYVVTKLERDQLEVIVGDSRRLAIENLRLSVPEGIEVYRVIRSFEGEGELLFTVRESSNFIFDEAYLSVIRKSGNSKINELKLLAYPWFDSKTSLKIFTKLLKENVPRLTYTVNEANGLIVGGTHPFSK